MLLLVHIILQSGVDHHGLHLEQEQQVLEMEQMVQFLLLQLILIIMFM